MQESTRIRIVGALAGAYGNALDNANRARAAFRGQKMDEEYGQSGMTRQTMLANYESEERATLSALLDFDPTWTPRKVLRRLT